jgi:glutamyl-tRNA(Gln) amidotransferase subunit D
METQELYDKYGLSEGQLVSIKKGKQELTGYLLPILTNKKNIIRLKLKSGYNIGIKISEKLEIKKLEDIKKPAKAEKKEIKQNPKLPKIAILHTGGTIAGRVDYRTGGIETSFEPEDLLTMFPELMEIGNFTSKLITKMWSDDLRFKHIEILAKEAKKEYETGVKGIIIGIGTDNLAVASAGLSFAIEKCPIPIILVGSQRSSDRGSSDAAMNLICAAQFIAQSDFAGVAICMHNSSSDDKCAILPACKTKKLHSSRRDAFKPINDTPIAYIDYETKKIEFIKKNYSKRTEENMIIKPNFEEKVGLLKAHVNMFPEQFEFFHEKKYKGLVIEGTGLGHIPGHDPNEYTAIHRKIFPALKKFIDNGGIAIMTTNTVYGRVQMHVYDKGIDIANLGVISGEDMLPETALVKLSWLLGNYPPNEAKKLITKNLRGEISEFTRYD